VPTPLSAGILLFRQADGEIQVLLGHPGGPFWRNKDKGAWMIPKGAVEPGERPAEAAVREYEEELGSPLRATPFPLCTIRQKGGKIVEVFAAEGEFDPATLTSLKFEMEWPPRSGERVLFPEIDKARWMDLAEAHDRILPSQLPILEALEEKLRASGARVAPTGCSAG
jgi:predicted NUDIX family NTP pyrophosphohydrolase